MWQAAIQSVDPNMRDTANVYVNVAYYDDAILDSESLPVVQFVSQLVVPVATMKESLLQLVQAEGAKAQACYLAAQRLIVDAKGIVIPITPAQAPAGVK